MSAIIKSVLDKFLGKYVEGLGDKNNISIGLFDGVATIQNVSVKPSFINELGLPFTLKFSHIERIHIDLPWTNLKEKHTFVTVRGIYVLLNISYEQIENDVNPEDLLKTMMQRIKEDMKKKWSDIVNTQDIKKESYGQKRLIYLVDNLILSISNIHIRLQSFRRGWDYSMGVLMDGISSFTVDQDDRQIIYHRSFSKKQTNKPYKKILQIQKFQLYFNDEEKVFISNLMDNTKQFLINIMAHPFPNRDNNNNKDTSSPKKKVEENTKPYPPYSIKNMATVAIRAIGTQRFAQDMRFIIDVNVQINTISFRVSGRQLSQIIHCVQHFYDFGLNIIKNGKKGYNFDATIQKNYRSIITKIAKQEKIQPAQRSQLLTILREVPLTVLEAINDEIINSIRYEAQIKRISKVMSAEKSKKMMQELIQQKQKLDAMEGVDMFKEIEIATKIHRFNVSMTDNKDISILQLGLIETSFNVHMDLNGFVVIRCDIMNAVINARMNEISKDHFLPTHQFVNIAVQLNKNNLKVLNVKILKKQIFLTEQILDSFLDWISLIKIRSSLLNFINQQLDYSIDMTRVMMQFLFGKNRDIAMTISIPIMQIAMKNDINLTIDLGVLLGNSLDNNSKFQFQFGEQVIMLSDKIPTLRIDKGSCIIMTDKIAKVSNYQKVQIILSKMNVINPQQIIKVLYKFMHSQFHKRYSSLKLIDESAEEELDGEFHLNKIKNKLNSRIVLSELIFYPKEMITNFPQQKISLVRTRIYKLVNNKRYYIVFKEEVQKQVNIVEAQSQKVMQTIFMKLKDYIQQISTAFQWQKYYRQIYKENIDTLQQIQDVNLKNDILMTLSVNLKYFTVNIAEQTRLHLDQIFGIITYNEFNTEAALELKKLDAEIEGEKIIYDASFKGSYHCLQSKVFQFQVCKLSYQVKLFKTISKIIAISSQYQLLVFSLRSMNKRTVYATIEEDENRLSDIKSQSNRVDNINKFLLEMKMSVETVNIQGEILGYRNKLSYIKLDVMKYRNEPHPRIHADLKGILLLSMIQLPSIKLKFTPSQLELTVDSMNAQIDMETIIYEVVRGQGSLILKQLIKSLRDRKIAKTQYKERQRRLSQNEEDIKKKIEQSRVIKKRNLFIKIEEVRIETSLTGCLCLGVNLKDLQLSDGRFSWNGTLFWLNNDCISMGENNGIIKWTQKQVDLCMTNFKMKFNSKEIMFLINELLKIYKFLKANNFDAIRLVEEQFSSPDEKGRVAVKSDKKFNLRIEEVEIVYECGDKNPLLSIRLRPLFFTNDGIINSINLSIWHLNRSLKLYEPIIQPFELKIIEKTQTHQYELILQQLYVIITQEFVFDCLHQIKLLKQIHTELSKDESNQLQEMTVEQVEKNKAQLLQQHFQYYQLPNFQQHIQYSCMVKIFNRLGCKAIVEISCNKKREQLFFEDPSGADAKAIYLPQKTSYDHSYELIERYQKIKLKVCLINGCYATRTVSFEFLLYDQDNYYIQPAAIMDSNGIEMSSALAIKACYNEGAYMIDIIGMYNIQNTLSYPLYFRYSDSYSINKFTLNENQQNLLPPWIVQYVTFGLREGEYNHILRLRPKDCVEEGGFFQLSIQHTPGKKMELVLIKEKIQHKVKDVPKLQCFKNKGDDSIIIDQYNEISRTEVENVDQDNKQEQEQQKLPSIFKFKIIPGLLLINHLNFPITVNNTIFQTNQTKQLYDICIENERQYISLTLGDESWHEIFIPKINEPLQVNLKLSHENFVTLFLQVRRNKSKQRMLHIYSQVMLCFNIPNLHQPVIVTNIYQYNFIMKKQVKNGWVDKVHPAPILKDKFIFSTYHYLLNLEEKYVHIKLNNCTSNEIIIYHSDFDKDLRFKNDIGQQEEMIYAVSYDCKVVNLESDQQGRKPEILECFYTYFMPKYYLINRSEGTFVVNGSVIFRNGQKINVNNIKFLDLNIRDQLQFKYIPKNLDNSNSLIFVRGTEQDIENISNRADVDVRERLREINSHFQNLQSLRIITQASQASTARVISENVNQELQKSQLRQNQNKIKPQMEQDLQEQKSIAKDIRHTVRMEDINIYALSKRICEYSTICYEINQWNEWLSIKNQLKHPLVLRVRLNKQILGIQYVKPSTTSRIISGLSEIIEIAVLFDGYETILGQFSLVQRLNHTIFMKECDYEEINIRQNKIKVGRLVSIICPNKSTTQIIHKVQNSLSLRVGKISISLILHQDKVRKQLIRLNITEINLLMMKYCNGLYMFHLQFELITGIFKRVIFLVLRDFKGYLQGVQGEFLQRLQLQFGDTMHITLSDQLIVQTMAQIQIIEKHIPSNVKINTQQKTSQEQQTYHINSLGIKGIQIRLCMRKTISDMNQNKARLMSKLSLSIVEVEDAYIHLSSVEIDTPLRQKHINGISKMYTMESFVGIASGLNILGNPAQFANQFQAGRNVGGVVPFFRSIVAGTSNSVSKIIGTIGSSVSQLTFDRQFMKHRINNKNIKVRSFGQGLKVGLLELAHSVKSGFTGLVQQPVQGFRQEGGEGALRGAVAGLTGLITKPLTGVIFAASKTIQGINSSTTYLDYKILQSQELITRPLYHKFKLVRPYKSQDELAYNMLLNWYNYTDVQLISSYFLQSLDDDNIVDILIITCSEMFVIDLEKKQIKLKVTIEDLRMPGKFSLGVNIYYRTFKNGEEDLGQCICLMRSDSRGKENLFWTIKGFLALRQDDNK